MGTPEEVRSYLRMGLSQPDIMDVIGMSGNLVIEDPKPLAEGWESVIYSLDCKHDGGTALLAIRMYNGPWARHKAEKEFKGMRCLMGIGYPVPRVYLCDPEGGSLGQPFMIMERIEGMHLGRAFDTGSDEDKVRIAATFFDTFTRLHNMDFNDFDPEAMGLDPTDPLSYADKHLTWMMDMFNGEGLEDIKAIFAGFHERRAEVPCPRYSVLHGDYHPFNILLQEDGSPAVLDWSMLAVGDPKYDLAWSLLISGGLESEEKYGWMVDGYWKSRGEEPQDFSFYQGVAAAFRLAVAVLAIRNGASSLGLQDNATEIMKNSRDHYSAVYHRYTLSTGRREKVFDDLMDELR